MSAGYLYSLSEGVKGLRRAKFSTFVAVFSIFLSLIIIGFFLIFIFNMQRTIAQIKSRMELEVFIDNSFMTEQIDALRQKMVVIPGIDSVLYVSKDAAAMIFKQEFGQDIFEILDDNPLPPSFRIKLKPAFQSVSRAGKISSDLSKLEGVSEVLYRHDLLALLEKYMRIFLVIVFGIGSLLAIGSIFLVYNTIKLIILSRRSTIEIMKLVGATRRFIRRPFLVEGLIQGFIGGSLAALFFYSAYQMVKKEISGLILVDPKSYPILILLGMFFGLIGSLFALRKFLRYD